MKRTMGKYARLLLAALPLMAGCGNFWAPPSDSGGSNTNTTLSSGNFYILNTGTSSSQIYGFNITTGKLTTLSGSPYAVTGTAYNIAMDPAGNFLYVSTTDGGVYLYAINASTGALTAGTQVSQDPIAKIAISIDTSGAWLIEALPSGQLAAIPITSAGAFDNSGSRTEQTVALAGADVEQMMVSPDHSFVAVAEGATGTQVFPFTAGAAKPIGTALKTIAPYNSAGAVLALGMDPSTRLLYIGETATFPSSTTSSGGLRAFAVTAGPLAVTELTGSPYASGGTGPHVITPSATGDYVYVASWQGTSKGLITPFQVTSSGSTFSLSAQSNTIATGVSPVGLAEDGESNFMLAVNSGGSPSFNAYIFDTTTTGKLDQTNTDSTASGPIAIVAAP